MGEKRNTYKILVMKPEKKETTMLRGLISTADDNIKKDRKEIGWLGLYWIRLVQDRDKCQAAVNTVIRSYVYWTVHHCDS